MKRLFSRLRTVVATGPALLELIITHLPGDAGNLWRHAYYRRRLRSLGKGAIIDVGVFIQNPQYVAIGPRVWLDKHVLILAGPPSGDRETRLLDNSSYLGRAGELKIGANSHIAPFCVLSAMGGLDIGENVGIASGGRVYSFSHHYRSLRNESDTAIYFTPLAPPDRQFLISGPVVIANNVGLALQTTVLPGVTIFQDSFLLSGSVVTKDIPPNSLAAGNPAKVIGRRFRALDERGTE